MPRFLAVSLALLALVVGTFGGVVGHGFVTLDDHGYILDNPQVRHGLSWDGLRWALTSTYGGQLAPGDLGLAHAGRRAVRARRPAAHHL